MIYRDIIESSGYEHASANASIMVRYGTYDINVMAIDTDDEEKTVTFLTNGPIPLEFAHLLEIDPNELADILDYTVYVDSPDGGDYFEAEDVFLDVIDDGQEIFVIFTD